MEKMIKPFHSAGIYYSGDRFDVELPDVEKENEEDETRVSN